jgi:D-threonate/D-erythronate kinase
MPRVLVIADDLTGAADTGLQFYHGVRRVQIWFADDGSLLSRFCEESLSASDALVLTTETRHATDEQAEYALREVGKAIAPFATRDSDDSLPTLFKKIDSTLRGGVGVETRALLDELPGRIAWIVPAYPKQGRRMENGVYTVNGVPLAATAFAHDIRHLSADSRIAPLLEAQIGKSVGFIGADFLERRPGEVAGQVNRLTESGLRAVLFDAVTDEHIARIIAVSELCEGHPLWVGSAGLAGAMVPRDGSVVTDYRADISQPGGGPVIVVAGSRHPVTARQIGFLKTKTPSLHHRIVPLSGQTTSSVSTAHILLTLPESSPSVTTGDALRAASLLGAETARVIQETGSRRLILTGGDIAAAVCRSLGVQALEIVGAIEEAIPLLRLRGGIADGAFAVTKAGGFGAEESLHRAFKFLSGNESPVS